MPDRAAAAKQAKPATRAYGPSYESAYARAHG